MSEQGDFLGDPEVIDPIGFDCEAAWAECRDYVDRCGGLSHGDGEPNWAAAFGADPGCCSCPSCRAGYWAWGKVIRCRSCGFEFPTDWWPRFSRGAGDAPREHAPPARPERADCPYYMHGWRNPGLGYEWAFAADWRPIVASFEPWVMPADLEAAIAAEEALGDCKHYRGLAHVSTCAAGVSMRRLVGGEDLGWASRLPCLASFRRRANGPIAECPKFAARTPAEEATKRQEAEEMMRRAERVMSLMAEVKREYKGKSVTGSTACPICDGEDVLKWRHSGYNGHIAARCANGCINIVE